MSMPEEETQKLRVEAATGARDGWHEGDVMVVGVRGLILVNFLLGGLLHRPVEVVRVAKLAILRRLVGCPPALVGHRVVEDKGAVHPIVVEVARDLHVPSLVALAGGDGRLRPYLMTERAEERLQLRDGQSCACVLAEAIY